MEANNKAISRQLILLGSIFDIEQERAGLRQPGTGYFIPFSTFQLSDGLYTAVMDLNTKAVIDKQNQRIGFDPAQRTVIIPAPVFQAEEPLSEAYARLVNTWSNEEKKNAILVSAELSARLYQNELPTVTIAGDPYEIHVEQMKLVLKSDPSIAIDLKSLQQESLSKSYIFFYNQRTKQVVKLDLNLTAYPKDVVRIELPNYFHLDPVGMAKVMGMAPTALLNTYPYRRNQQARSIPLSETWVKDCIAVHLASKRQRQHRRRSRGKKNRLNG